MSKYAVIDNNIITNIVIAGGPLYPNWVLITGLNPQPGIGWSYTGSTFLPPSPPPAIIYNRIKTEAFWERFTNSELVDYEVAMQHDPAASNANKKDAAKLRIFQRDADSTGYRNLTKNKVTNFITSMESPLNGVTILASGRANTILSTPITEEESYRGS